MLSEEAEPPKALRSAFRGEAVADLQSNGGGRMVDARHSAKNA